MLGHVSTTLVENRSPDQSPSDGLRIDPDRRQVAAQIPRLEVSTRFMGIGARDSGQAQPMTDGVAGAGGTPAQEVCMPPVGLVACR